MAFMTLGLTKAAILAPLTALSAVSTAALLSVGGPATTPASSSQGTLPDGTHLPVAAIQQPASVSSSGYVAPGVPQGMTQQAVATASTSGIPAAALDAYQRAASVINAADQTCQMPWQLVAAIGRVESDHGRANGNTLTDRGISTPGIYGPQLNGRNGTQMIRDTDNGQFDHDTAFDRAVGPMQFIPSTWAVVGVDGDNDGQRNPQDINDAALGTSVYLCSGGSDLSTDQGQRSAVFRYNHSQQYVDLVLAIMHSYMSGNFTSVPNTSSSVGFNFPAPGVVIAAAVQHNPVGSKHTGGGSGSSGGGSVTPTKAPTLAPSAPAPSQPVSTTAPTPLPTKLPTTLPSPLPSDPTSALPSTLTKDQASAQCLAQLGVSSVTALNPLQLTQYQDCMAKLGF